jgi:hypothetical protein
LLLIFVVSLLSLCGPALIGRIVAPVGPSS